MTRGVFVGLATLDVVHRVSHRPGPDEKVTASRQDWAAGGPATNAAVTHAALGGDAVLVTALGRGPLAGLVRADLAEAGVTIIDATPDADLDVAVSAITVVTDTGERAVVSRDAAAHRVDAPAELSAVLAGADSLLVDGHHPGLARAAVAAAHDVEVTVDAGRWKTVFADLLPRVDAAICSAGFRLPGSTTQQQAAAAMLATGPRLVAFTNGAGPVQWWTDTDHGEVTVPAVTAVDTLGAGDAFHGAWCFARGDDDIRLRFAADVAARRVQEVGPRDWLARIRPPGQG